MVSGSSVENEGRRALVLGFIGTVGAAVFGSNGKSASASEITPYTSEVRKGRGDIPLVYRVLFGKDAKNYISPWVSEHTSSPYSVLSRRPIGNGTLPMLAAAENYDIPRLGGEPDMSEYFSINNWLELGARRLELPIDSHFYTLYLGHLPSEDGSSIKLYAQVAWLTRHEALGCDQFDIFIRPNTYESPTFSTPADYAAAKAWNGIAGGPPTDQSKCIFQGDWTRVPANCDPQQLEFITFVAQPDYRTDLDKAYQISGQGTAEGYKACLDVMNPPAGKPLDLAQYNRENGSISFKFRMSIGNLFVPPGPGHTLVPVGNNWLDEGYMNPAIWPTATLNNLWLP